MKKISLFALLTILMSCTSTSTDTDQRSSQDSKPKRPVALDNGKIFDLQGAKMLYGGEDSTSHFNIENSELKDGQYHYGIGRERFPALLQPEFISVSEADSVWSDTSRFLVAYSGDISKAYSIDDLTRHEVVNDVLDGKPIMAAYCILADLGAIYDRNYGETKLTFALSGYTYYDEEVWDGLDGFVLWDRETESLWWPLIGRAVSGPLKGVRMNVTDESLWTDTTWKEVKKNYPEAQVLKWGLDFERPTSWDRLTDVKAIVNSFGHSN